MSKILTAQVQFGDLFEAGTYKTEYSYDGNTSFDSWGGNGSVVRTGKPMENPAGRDCNDPLDCVTVKDNPGGPSTWAVYDFGGLWTNVDRIQVRSKYDGDYWCAVSADKISWYETWVHRVTWAAATCATRSYNAGQFNQPPGFAGNVRYIRFRSDQLFWIGDHSDTAWFNIRGDSPDRAAILTDDVQLGDLPSASKIYPVGVQLG